MISNISNVEILLRLAAAAALGSMVGFERERLLWAAGIRTHMLVCVGSCLIMIVSAYGFAGVLGQEHTVLDPSRVAAQVVSGIGFLGAGSILARGEIIKGLTTAASIWTVAAIGLAIGGGLYFAGTASTILILIILAGVKPLEEAYRARNQTVHFKITAERGALSPEELRQTLSLRVSQIKRFVVENRSGDEGNDEILVLLNKVSSQDIADFKNRLNEVPAIRRVDLISRSAADNSSAT
ncbi:putative Mg(2+) transport ATPase [Afipia felis]|uniref:Protein MgtC n=1 Tax=Afipia felis TaxID=1035 RepID=A0A090MQA8_AFIFE|nr:MULTISPECIES: MgtC/SapB family protein [Afipia]EFI51630.1 MgtC/SapB transporter [Afipia sp. 1NLS2]CEG08397.1 putative Mg(2+) transport ATPase [Afipia felis]